MRDNIPPADEFPWRDSAGPARANLRDASSDNKLLADLETTHNGESSPPEQSISDLLEQAHSWSAFSSGEEQQVVEQLIRRWQRHCDEPVVNRLGKFELIERIGGGGYGVVYRARDVESERTVALKVLRPKSAADFLDAVNRFQREAEVATLLVHPHVVRGLETGSADGRYFLTMEYAQQGSLRELLKRRGRLAWREAAELIRQAADGLAHLDAHGWVHRDLKPGNLLLTEDNTVKIGDLGLVREPPRSKPDSLAGDEQDSNDESDATSLTTPGRVLGTLHYMAPEQGIHSRVSIAADIYSLGAVLFELIAGRPLVDDLSARHNLHYRAWRDAPRLSSVAAEVPPELDKIVARMLARLPEDRYASPNDVVAALSALLADPANDETAVQRRRVSRRTWGVGLSLAACAAVGVPWLWTWYRDEDQDDEMIVPPDERATDDRWDTLAPTKDSRAYFQRGEWILRNRGWLVSKEEFPDGVKVEFDWQWTEGEGTYSDNLAVGFYTTGRPGTTNWASELEDGLIVRFQPDPPPGTIMVLNVTANHNLAETFGPSLPKKNEMHVRIDAGTQEIRVYLNQGARPVLRCPVPRNFGDNHRVCIYNRERVAGIDKESRLRNIRLAAPSDKDA